MPRTPKFSPHFREGVISLNQEAIADLDELIRSHTGDPDSRILFVVWSREVGPALGLEAYLNTDALGTAASSIALQTLLSRFTEQIGLNLLHSMS